MGEGGEDREGWQWGVGWGGRELVKNRPALQDSKSCNDTENPRVGKREEKEACEVGRVRGGGSKAILGVGKGGGCEDGGVGDKALSVLVPRVFIKAQYPPVCFQCAIDQCNLAIV